MSTLALVGSGAREHAIAWKMATSRHVKRLILAPGNDAMVETLTPFLEVSSVPLNLNGDQKHFAEFAGQMHARNVDLVFVGPDNPLANGIVDECLKLGLKTFGPTRLAAQLESSKSFAKGVMQHAEVQTADFEVFENAKDPKLWGRVKSLDEKRGVVIKLDGLAYGKGVLVANTREECETFLKLHENSPQKIVVEEKVEGEEISLFAFCDGESAKLFEVARDYKRVFDGDLGPNTGGMGSYSPVEGGAAWAKQASKEVFRRVLKIMQERGIPFKGLLFAGLMCDPKTKMMNVLEFNARFGDPETQALLPRFDEDLFEWATACAEGSLHMLGEPKFLPESAVYVVAGAEGYPENPELGHGVQLPWKEWNQSFTDRKPPPFFAGGLTRKDGRYISSGGRVCGALGVAPTQESARQIAYENLEKIQFARKMFRKDIAQ